MEILLIAEKKQMTDEDIQGIQKREPFVSAMESRIGQYIDKPLGSLKRSGCAYICNQ